jgi:TonB family protein
MIGMSISAIAVKLAVSLLLAVVVIPPAIMAEEPEHRVSEEDAKKSITSKVNPTYPVMARQMRLGGKVQVDAYVDTAGKVEKVQVINGNALLSSAAVRAVKQWKFTPFTADGKAVTAITRLTFSFAP